jgi:hypothetical protein
VYYAPVLVYNYSQFLVYYAPVLVYNYAPFLVYYAPVLVYKYAPIHFVTAVGSVHYFPTLCKGSGQRHRSVSACA